MCYVYVCPPQGKPTVLRPWLWRWNSQSQIKQVDQEGSELIPNSSMDRAIVRWWWWRWWKELGLAWRTPGWSPSVEGISCPGPGPASLLSGEYLSSTATSPLGCSALPQAPASSQVKPLTQTHFPSITLLYQIFVTSTRLDKYILLQNIKLKIWLFF